MHSLLIQYILLEYLVRYLRQWPKTCCQHSKGLHDEKNPSYQTLTQVSMHFKSLTEDWKEKPHKKDSWRKLQYKHGKPNEECSLVILFLLLAWCSYFKQEICNLILSVGYFCICLFQYFYSHIIWVSMAAHKSPWWIFFYTLILLCTTIARIFVNIFAYILLNHLFEGYAVFSPDFLGHVDSIGNWCGPCRQMKF